MQKKQWRNVEIRPSGAKGHGLFAAEDIDEESFVLEYHGEVRAAFSRSRQPPYEHQGHHCVSKRR